MTDFSGVGDVGQELVQVGLRETGSTPRLSLFRRPALGRPAPAVEFFHHRQQCLTFEIQFEDFSDAFGLDLVDDEFRIGHVVTENRNAAGPSSGWC